MSDINPEMLRVARVSRGWTQTDAARILGIKQPTYSKIENGSVELSTGHLERLAQGLNYPPEFFRQSDRIWGTASPHHRRRKSVSPTRLQELEAQLNVLRLQVKRLAASVEIAPTFSVPNIDLDLAGTPSEVAREVRRQWRMPSGLVTSVTRALEDAGVVIVEIPLSEKMDAISVWGPGEPPTVLLNRSFTTDRKRLTLAHELGHLVMHVSEVTEDPEAEAGDFAREFLMPAREIRPELRHLSLNRLPDLKRRWKCSMRSIVYHARALDELTRDQARYLYMRLNQEYGAKREPIELPAEPPTLMRELLDRHLVDLGYSVDELATAAKSEPEEFKTLHDLQPRRLHVV